MQGGVGESITFGLNWYWNSNARMQFNYIYGNIYNNELNAVNGIDIQDMRDDKGIIRVDCAFCSREFEIED